MTQTAEVINFARPYVKADIDNGYDRLAHDLTNALARNYSSLSGCEYQVVFALISKTFRFQKSSDWIANIQLCEITGMSDAHISKTLRSLKAKNVVIKQGKKTGINPVISEWKLNQSVNKRENKNLTNQFDELNQSVQKVNQSVKKKQPIRPTQKKETNTKETNTKEKVGAKRATRIPENFSVTPEMESWAKAKNFTFNLQSETENFILYWQGEGKTKVDWQATWKSWMNRTQQRFGSAGAPRQSASRARPENFSSKDYGNDLVRF
tara:strand:- start:34240 stop:35037 length:798 start_codon:yes stop_codon:yes gene_type:complete